GVSLIVVPNMAISGDAEQFQTAIGIDRNIVSGLNFFADTIEPTADKVGVSGRLPGMPNVAIGADAEQFDTSIFVRDGLQVGGAGSGQACPTAPGTAGGGLVFTHDVFRRIDYVDFEAAVFILSHCATRNATGLTQRGPTIPTTIGASLLVMPHG